LFEIFGWEKVHFLFFNEFDAKESPPVTLDAHAKRPCTSVRAARVRTVTRVSSLRDPKESGTPPLVRREGL
jgi:hypothetical protein